MHAVTTTSSFGMCARKDYLENEAEGLTRKRHTSARTNWCAIYPIVSIDDVLPVASFHHCLGLL